MSKFKVGDKVVRTEALNHGGLVKGGVYTVAKVNGKWIQVEGNSTHAWDDCPFHEDYFKPAQYSSYFTEQPAKAEPTTGHAAGSPIQKHSKGAYYPLCVVGYSDAGRTAFTVENLEQGTVVGFAPGEFKGGSNIRAWGSAAGAYRWLDDNQHALKAGAYKMIGGRPTFIENSYGIEVVIPPEHKRWAVVLDKVDPNKVMLLNGVYYKALEQDIG